MNFEARGLSNANDGGSTNNDPKDLYKVLIGAVAGAAVGTLIAGAFTEKGVEIRNRVGEGGKNIANSLKDKVSGVTEAISDKYEAAKEGAADLIEKGKQKIGMGRSNMASESNLGYSGDATYGSTGINEAGAGSKILLGALIVSVASTLVWGFATEKGNETRRRIAKGSKNLATNVKEKVSDVAGGIVESVSDVYQSAKEGAADLLEQQKERLATEQGNPSYKSSNSADNW